MHLLQSVLLRARRVVLHACVDGSHTYWAPPDMHALALSFVHCTHIPDRHTFCPGMCPQSASAMHCVHACALQREAPAALQSPLTLHCAHMFVVVSHTGVIPVQALALLAVHCTQAPLVVLQAGVAVRALQSLLPAQRVH